jgi:ACS family glucarate transporter-like MFS transporter
MNESGGLVLPRLELRRFGVVLALFLLSMITYIDRASISTANDPIAAELNLSNVEMGMVFSSFALGYAVMQLPAGWLVDTVGPRAALAGAVGFWSVLTSLTGLACSSHSLLTIRFLFGAGEAAVFPSSARAIRNWLLPAQRGRANGALFAGSRLGAAFSYPLVAWMLGLWSWRLAFMFLGLGGLIWTSGWLMWFRDLPQEDSIHRPKGAVASKDVITRSTWMTATLSLAMLQYFASNFTNLICLSWTLPYLKTQYHLSISHAAAYSMAPLLLGAIAQGVAGSLADRIYSSRLRPWSRRLPAIIGFSLAAIGLAGITHAQSIGFAVIAFSLAIFGADIPVSPSWVFCTDVAGARTGRVSGAMNMCGSIGALVSANAFPFLQHKTGTSSVYFSIAALLDLAGIRCWLGMRSLGPIATSQTWNVPEAS